jgi:hypothetical protein
MTRRAPLIWEGPLSLPRHLLRLRQRQGEPPLVRGGNLHLLLLQAEDRLLRPACLRSWQRS